MKEGWKFSPLSEIATLRPPKKEAKAILNETDEVSFVPMESLLSGQKELAGHENRPLAKVYDGYTYFRDGDVLLAKITPCFENGKLGIARDLKNSVGFGSSEFFVIRPSDEVLAEFVYYFLGRSEFRESAKGRMRGAVGHKRVPKELLEALPIPLPPLDEQKRIVAILDEAFEGLDRARTNAEANLANAKALFESYIFTVFSGKGWPEKTLNQISENFDSKRVPITKSNRVAGNIPYYGASGAVDLVADFLFDEDLLLVSEDGANLLARTYPIAFSISGKSWVNNHAHVLKFNDLETQEFVRLYLNSISLEPYVSGMAQPKLNQTQLNRIPVPFPDRTERIEMVAKADLIAAQKNELHGRYDEALQDLSDLRQSLLQRAFAGKLT